MPLLTPAEEIELGNQVQTMMNLVEQGEDAEFTAREKKLIRVGRRSKADDESQPALGGERCQEYQGKGWSCWI